MKLVCCSANVVVVVVAVVVMLMSWPLPPARAGQADALTMSQLESLPLAFEPNLGQGPQDADMVARAAAYDVALSAQGVRMYLHDQRRSVLSMTLEGARRQAVAQPQSRQPGHSAYFRGNDPNGWVGDVPRYDRVRYQAVYPGIDVVYHGNQRRMQFDFVVEPGGDPARIKLAFEGADSLAVDADGTLRVALDREELTLSPPLVYQPVGAEQRVIAGRFVRMGADRVGFAVDNHDPALPLVIDPVITFASYLGGNAIDFPQAVALDDDGNMYLTGATQSANFPRVGGPLPSPCENPGACGQDTFVVKINSAGQLVYSLFLGGTGAENSQDLALDAAGNVYLTGLTNSTDFPTTPGAFRVEKQSTAFWGFVTKVNSVGTGLAYSTYTGPTGPQEVSAIVVNASGEAFVAGSTSADDFPTTPGVLLPTKSEPSGVRSSYVLQLNGMGSDLLHATYIGGSTSARDLSLGTRASALAVDDQGRVFVAGRTTSDDFPTTSGALQTQPQSPGVMDVFVSKLSPGMDSLLVSTRLGGGADSFGAGMAVNSSGGIYLAGHTQAPDFPTTNDALDRQLRGTSSVFLAHLSAQGDALLYGTLLGGNGADELPGFMGDLRLVNDNEVLLLGRTNSGNFPLVEPLQANLGGGSDAFLARLNPAGGGLLFSTYLGGSGSEIPYGLAHDSQDNIVVVMQTNSIGLPVVSPFQPMYGGGIMDVYIVRISPGELPTPNPVDFNRDGVVDHRDLFLFMLNRDGAVDNRDLFLFMQYWMQEVGPTPTPG